jgi:hypothetical protein
MAFINTGEKCIDILETELVNVQIYNLMKEKWHSSFYFVIASLLNNYKYFFVSRNENEDMYDIWRQVKFDLVFCVL